MSVVKKTWDKLLTDNTSITTILTDTSISNALSSLDTAFNTKYGSGFSVFNSCYADIVDDYFKAVNNRGNGLWEDLPIFMSSYKVKDTRILKIIKDKLIKYSLFLAKVVTDDGFARRLSTSRAFSNHTESTSDDKNIFSETPQIELDNFENAIKFASNVGQNNGESDTLQNGTSTENTSVTSWDEARKNLEYAFYNEMLDYIVSLPNVVYDYYCLDSHPVTELFKARKEYFRNLMHL